ncbi:sugar phosphate isomerase/epimerase [Phragmitibacter flavus]|uniref:Sugar phosphate isomerase/epimerase n=2 Tax=Phragmitibacter flavus TaxID=2576071 RepID=A0A5R8KFL0_9BACT|nr:sugar phosphate isomerase/epimerase [Phragmitibacter flavus]
MFMKTWPIGLSTGCFYQRGFVDVLEQIRNSGFRVIEICSFPKHLDYHREDEVERAAMKIRELDMLPFSFHAPFADHIDITSFDSGVREAAVQELLTACRAAAVLGVRHVVLHPGPERSGRPPSHEFLEHMKHAAVSLDRVARVCCDLGIELLLENMLPHLLFGHVSDMMYLLGEIRECNVGACLDTGHANLAGELGTTIHTLSGHLKMLHVNDNRRDTDAHLPPGEGLIDWPWLVGELDKYHFAGSLILELSGGANEPVEVVLERATRARSYLEGLTLSLA